MAGQSANEVKNNRFVLAFNGEIYDHHELRSELNQGSAPINWSGHSDTETLVECFAH